MSDSLTPQDIAKLSELATSGQLPVAPPASEAVSAATGGRQRQIRKMDFARPSKFNKDQLRTLQMIHEAFSRHASTVLSGQIRTLVDVSVQGAEQIPYGDYVDGLPNPTFTAVLEVAPHNTTAMASIELPLLFAMIDRMLGGPGSMVARVRELTDIESSIARNLMERMLLEMSKAWSDLVDVEFRLRGLEMNAQFAQITSATDPCVLVTMELAVGEAMGQFSLCVPYRSIESVVEGLAAHRYFATDAAQRGEHERLIANLRKVCVEVSVEVGTKRMRLSDVQALKSGDIINLGQRATDGMRLVAGPGNCWRVTPGRDGRRKAVQIVEAIDE